MILHDNYFPPVRRQSPSGGKLRRILTVIAAVALAIIVAERDASAYTDPGSGALMWQLLLAAMVGVSFYFRKFIGWIRNWRKRPQDDPTANEDA